MELRAGRSESLDRVASEIQRVRCGAPLQERGIVSLGGDTAQPI